MGWKVVVDVSISSGVVAEVEMERADLVVELQAGSRNSRSSSYGLAPGVRLKHNLDAHLEIFGKYVLIF